jgi:DNA-binding NtrC family response regulator
VLVVEDDVEMRRLLVKALRSDQREITDAADGEEAIRHIRENDSFDVIVSDVKMPNADGNAVLKEAVANHPRSKVVLITAFGEVEDYLEAMDNGAFEYLVKPLKMADLTRVVNRALEQPGNRV